MSTCKSCETSGRLVTIQAHCSDSFYLEYENKDHYEGYVPANIGLGTDSDDVCLTYCLECGTIQGDFPISDKAVHEALATDNPDFDEDEDKDEGLWQDPESNKEK